MKIIISLLLIIVLVSCGTSTQKVSEKIIITGQYTPEKWQKECGWKDFSAADFNPDSYFIDEIANLTNHDDIKYLLFAGSWCGDSESEVPKILKLLNLAKLQNNLTLIGLDRAKSEPGNSHLPHNIERIPTLIIIKKDYEIGRIIEFPKKSWEIDIYEILVKH